MKEYICIDIGGTSIKHGVVREDGTFAVTGEMPTQAMEYGGPVSRVRAKKTAQRSCSGFFQIRTCEALDGFGVWSYLCRPKREKSFVIVMPLHLHDNDIYLFIVDAVYNSVMCGYMP